MLLNVITKRLHTVFQGTNGLRSLSGMYQEDYHHYRGGSGHHRGGHDQGRRRYHGNREGGAGQDHQTDHEQEGYGSDRRHGNRGARHHGRRGGHGYGHRDGQARDWRSDRGNSDGDRGDSDHGNWGRHSGRERGGGGGARGHRGGGPPPGLRGKDIGMFYARKSRAKTAIRERAMRPNVTMGSRQEERLSQILQKYGTAESAQSSSKGTPSYATSTEQWHETSVKMEPVENVEDVENVEEMEAFEESMAEAEVDYDGVAADDDTSPFARDVLSKYESPTDPSLNRLLQKEFEEKQSSAPYRSMQKIRRALPAHGKKEEILDVLSRNQCVVVSGETGCGKTTQVPQFILDDCIELERGSDCHIICTQPRRISAITVAERVAAERAESLGRSSGYVIRLESVMPRTTGSIMFCTTGIVLRMLESDPLLSKASHVIVDEVHERSIDSDLLMVLLKNILPKRPDLKVILMSATLNADTFSRYFYGCSMLHIPGFTHHVSQHMLEDIVEMTGYYPEKSRQKREKFRRGRKGHEDREEACKLEDWLYSIEKDYSPATLDALQTMDIEKVDLDLIKALILQICRTKPDGAILVFVPGWMEIKSLIQLLEKDSFFTPQHHLIVPLHSRLQTMNQRQVFNTPPPGVRKIVIATNIAETSITIEDVVYVIDCGKMRLSGFSPGLNMASLNTEWVARANAKQRKGRAGRVKPGECYHLFTRLRESEMADYLLPEMLRTRLEELCLRIKVLKLGRIAPFVGKAMDPPSAEALEAAIQNLKDMRALDEDENLLPLGVHLSRMPLDPHLGKMILFGAMFHCLDPVLTIAACLSFKDPFHVPMGKEREVDDAKRKLARESKSDHIMLVNAFSGWKAARGSGQWEYCRKYFLSNNTLQMLDNMRKQLAEIVAGQKFIPVASPTTPAANQNSENIELVKAIVAAGLYPNVARIMKHASKHRPTSLRYKEGKCNLHPQCVVNAESDTMTPWVIYHKMIKMEKVNIFDCSLVSPYSLLFFGGKFKTMKDGDDDCVSIEDWIVFNASTKTADLVMKLRQELDSLLEAKITRPGMTHWDNDSRESVLLRAIIDLVTMETKRNADFDNTSDYNYRRYDNRDSADGNSRQWDRRDCRDNKFPR